MCWAAQKYLDGNLDSMPRWRRRRRREGAGDGEGMGVGDGYSQGEGVGDGNEEQDSFPVIFRLRRSGSGRSSVEAGMADADKDWSFDAKCAERCRKTCRWRGSMPSVDNPSRWRETGEPGVQWPLGAGMAAQGDFGDQEIGECNCWLTEKLFLRMWCSLQRVADSCKLVERHASIDKGKSATSVQG